MGTKMLSRSAQPKMKFPVGAAQWVTRPDGHRCNRILMNVASGFLRS
jgi:hypothetical protein